MLVWEALSKEAQSQALKRPVMKDDESLQGSVSKILRLVQEAGDDTLRILTSRFDGAELTEMAVSPDEINSAIASLDDEVKQAIDGAYEIIRKFHAQQDQSDIHIETAPGVSCTLRIRPLQTVGLYVPGGSTPLTSSALMQGVPAQLAGCKKTILCSPPDRFGNMAPEIIYAASKCGIDSLYRVGGAQAIAAMAFGTESIPKVDKIFGPGNRYVTEAKRQVSQAQGLVAIDMPAGPSEVLVIADETADPGFVASDLLSQAEHGPDSQVVLLSTSQTLIEEVERAIDEQLKQLSRWKIAREALTHARYILLPNIETAIKVSDRYAPEHLILNFYGAAERVEEIQHAGSIFVGPWSPESAGDYASGTNHVLPTYGTARFTDSLSLKDFQKRSTVQHLTREGLEGLSTTILALAKSEGLDAHARAVSIRLEGESV
jgi:histidinol dehydrogenase